MKVVINYDYGGFSLSPKAVKRLAELKGRPCYFFNTRVMNGSFRYTPVSNPTSSCVSAFDIPNPNEALPDQSYWEEMTQEQRVASNEEYERHEISFRPDYRSDPDLIKVVEELGKEANGSHASIKIVEIPDGVDWRIEEHDGAEHIAEGRKWH
jgi:hypothetical protein